MFKLPTCLRVLVRHISTSSSRKSPIRSGFRKAFGKHLLLTNIFSSGILMFIGDICQQEFEYRRKKLPERYNYGRLTRMFLTGMALGPPQHYFYDWLAKQMPEKNMKTISKKLILDQLLMSPLSIAIFFYSMCSMEMKPFLLCTEEFKDKFVEVYLVVYMRTVDLLIGPPTQFINFHYVPVKYQVFYVNVVTMLFDIYLSYVKHKDE
ncbi:hypothetical protein NQ318_017668 [Aromia moschata]|uniref:Mpv17-like protein 2 n=1 Tax=Aromia moschata TaxID=1265417 RepID=A0AAV8XCM8_9CUCU|nr:hypothetical protein NQ318_017668 [Aromia moschata]